MLRVLLDVRGVAGTCTAVAEAAGGGEGLCLLLYNMEETSVCAGIAGVVDA